MDLMFNGQPAGGSLAGTYPNPTLAPAVIGPAQFGSIPAVDVNSGGDQPMTSGAVTVLAFPAETYDTANMHDTATNNSRLVAPIAGIYLITASVQWRASGGGTQRFASIRKNAVSSDLGITQVAPVNSVGNFTSEIVSAQVKLAAGDFVEVFVMQDSGATVNVANACHTQMTWISPGV